ncbi:unnamed protein product [Symbiodinium natans]|uniref:Uncharacterized protein n=1 Tax=Symbiodinium natans TaxID=878477 RepID=A0A812PCR9_9DINO|nr:unnamed protein product [Symbiodinium natans]
MMSAPIAEQTNDSTIQCLIWVIPDSYALDFAISRPARACSSAKAVDRDCQAMALALDDMDGGLPEGWVELLGLAASHGAAGDAPAPSLLSLETQLSLENDMLRAALKRAPK